jgi:hypothetical protein
MKCGNVALDARVETLPSDNDTTPIYERSVVPFHSVKST